MAKVDCSELEQLISDTAMLVGARTGYGELDQVLSVMRTDIPDLTRDYLVNSIAKASAARRREISDTGKILGALKREAGLTVRLRSKIGQLQRHLETGRALPETRRAAKKPPVAIKQMQDVIAGLKKEAAYKKRTAAERATLRAQISTLESHLKAGTTPTVAKRTPRERPEETQQLINRRNELRKQIADRDRTSAEKARIHADIDEIEGHLEAGTFPTRVRKAAKEHPEEMQQLIDKRRALRNELATKKRTKEAADRIRDRIADLERRIRERDVSRPEATPREPATGEVAQLRGREAELRNVLGNIRRGINAESRLAKQIDELQAHLEAGTLPEAAPRAERARTPAEQRLIDIRDDLRKRVAKSEPAVKARLEKSIAALEARLASGDIQPKPREPIAPQSKEIEDLRVKQQRLQADIRQRIEDLKPKSIWQHIGRPFNEARALITAYDFSGIGKQGGFITVAHPLRALKALPNTLKAFRSEKAAMRAMDEIMNRDNAALYARAGVDFSSLDSAAPKSKREEAFRGAHLVEKLPGVRGSERAYAVYLNMLRADSFDAMYRTLTKNREATQVELEALGRFVNEATGRGGLGVKGEKAADLLSATLFSPRYQASRFQMLVAHSAWKGTAATRKLILQEYARYLIGIGTVYALAKAGGAVVEDDPKSTDFGKIRIGNTRVDPMSGLSQATVLASRIWSGKRKTSRGDIRPIRGDVGYGQPDAYEVFTRALRYKLSPLAATAVDVATGKDAIGQPVTVGGEIADLVTPLAVRELYDILLEHDIPAATALGLLNMAGFSVQVYDELPKARLQR